MATRKQIADDNTELFEKWEKEWFDYLDFLGSKFCIIRIEDHIAWAKDSIKKILSQDGVSPIKIKEQCDNIVQQIVSQLETKGDVNYEPEKC